MPFSKWTDQKTVVNLHSKILHSRKKEGTPILHKSMDGTEEYNAKWNKTGGEREIPCDLNYKCNLINQTSEQNRTIDMEIKNKLTVTRGEERGA